MRTPLHSLMGALALALISLVLGCSSTGSQERGAIVSGLVVVEGVAMAGAQVWIRGHDAGFVTGESGRFTIRDVPPGSRVLQAVSIGYELHVTFLELGIADSVDVNIEMVLSPVPISGSDYPLASPERLVVAQRLLPDAMVEGLSLSLLKEYWPDLSRDDTIQVFGPWMRERDPIVREGPGPVLILVHECDECIAEPLVTIEGGRGYQAGVRHVRVGVRNGAVGAPRIGFCFGFAEEGDRLLSNCAGPPTGTAEMWYWEKPSGTWVRLLECGFLPEIGC